MFRLPRSRRRTRLLFLYAMMVLVLAKNEGKGFLIRFILLVEKAVVLVWG